MVHSWLELTRLTQGKDFVVEKIRIKDGGIVIKGEFELPKLVQMSADDLVFMAAFVKSHGSIKEMERLFGVSYPTVKNRLSKISKKLDFIDPKIEAKEEDVLDKLEAGEISAKDAIELLKK